jgi:hypothetical protein
MEEELEPTLQNILDQAETLRIELIVEIAKMDILRR